MKKYLYSILLFFSFVFIYSCTPLMEDLEKGCGKSNNKSYKNDVDISKVFISGTPRYEEILFAKVLDNTSTVVDGEITYQWEYYDDNNQWNPILGANEITYEIQASVINKQIRISVTKNNVTKNSTPVTVLKGLIDPESVVIDLPFVLYNEQMFFDDFLKPEYASIKSIYGKEIDITHLEYGAFDEHEYIKASTKIPLNIISDNYEEYVSADYNDGFWLKVKEWTFEQSDIPEIATENGQLYFDDELPEWVEYSIDNGQTWITSEDNFTTNERFILVRAKGTNYNAAEEVWEIYPSEPIQVCYRIAKFKVINFNLEQSDIELTFDATTGTLTMEEGYGEYIWFIKTDYHPEQDILMIGTGEVANFDFGVDPEHPNKFNLANFFEEMEENRPGYLQFIREDNDGDPWPEYGRPGKYYIQGVALTNSVIDSFLKGLPTIPLSATCWVELK